MGGSDAAEPCLCVRVSWPLFAKTKPAYIVFRRFGGVRRDALRFVTRQQDGRRSPSRLVLEIDVGERLTVLVLDGEAGFLLVDGGRRRAEGIERRWQGDAATAGRRGPSGAVVLPPEQFRLFHMAWRYAVHV